MVEASNVKKARIKSLDLAKRITAQRLKEEHSLEGAEKLKFDIKNIENTIRNCKWDLEGAFKGNMAIKEKLSIAEQQLAAKQEELSKLMQRDESAPQSTQDSAEKA